ncbi:sn-glycerol-3-phosphate ABC transporter ATP-binding protein UgpC [Aerococcus sp. UMB1112A]|uniref:ABC transporter ATP-binding protein n=1 Tax=Aerococcus sp. UMB1112A TaxID=3050609 RepID=UPI00254C8068|nr:sn-glycerol-3-phosphate ABC transporter ATP-binding protein UgpC [Aerococcus sp. UMB1112A]MDK8502619.1 sn-glycerol-3-phosphate ABC transporter ATP-binding protein UgpC [Aerococcus sp. UMB1112A]
MSEIELRNISKSYDGKTYSVKNLKLKIEEGEFIVLVGPSGCGKSTTLRMIAGLEAITSGELLIAGEKVNDKAPKDRNLAMVFQDYALYPHMTVYKNMAYPLKMEKLPKDEIDQKIQEAARLLGIEAYLDRRPKELSGGQKQRVALGRAIVRQPQAFLMDEPLSNLDAKLRSQMRYEISKLHRRLQTTMVYVTHDQTEAMTMGDRIVVMDQGEVQQIASPTEIYEDPANRFVAEFLGTPKMNFIPAQELAQSLVDIPAPLVNQTGIDFGIRPENLSLKDGSRYRVSLIENLGGSLYVYLDHQQFPDQHLIIEIPAKEAVEEGKTYDLAVDDWQKVRAFSQETTLAVEI